MGKINDKTYSLIPAEKLKLLAAKTERSSLHWVAAFNKKHSGKLDSTVHALHNTLFEQLDCLQCANCCKSLGPAIYDRDIERLAKGLKIKAVDFIAIYLRVDEDHDYVFKQSPCPFLDPQNYCLVYDNRPKACREYPHTDRSKFHQLLRLTVKNAAVCPAAYHVLEELKQSLT